MLKNYHGMEKAKFRGKDKVHIQFLLTASAINLKKMIKMHDMGWTKRSTNNVISIINKFILRFFKKRVEIPLILKA